MAEEDCRLEGELHDWETKEYKNVFDFCFFS